MANGAPMNPEGANAASKTLPLGTTAKVTNLETGQSAVVSIQDRGPGIAPEDLPHLFDRFYRTRLARRGPIGGTGLGRVNVAFRGTSGLAQGEAYTDNFFSVLGVTPQYGRFFSAGEDRPGASVAVISDRYWRNRFGADRSIIGRSVSGGPATPRP